MLKYTICLGAVSLLPIACSTGSLAASAAKERAETDLRCPRAQLVADRQRDNSAEFLVHGCGKQALYVCQHHSTGVRDGNDEILCRRF
jgi:hypothetical protein